MSDETKSDEAGKATETAVVEEKKGAADTSKEERKTETPSTRAAALDAVKARRAELAATSATEPKKQGDADAKKGSEKTDEKSADDDDSSDAQADDEQKDEGKKETRTFTEKEIARPGFFDSLDKEGWAALEKQHPTVVALYKSARADLSRYAEKIEQRAAAVEKSTKAAASSAVETATDAEEEELKALGFTATDLKTLLGSKVGQSIIRSVAEATVKSMGVDPERTEAQMSGFDLALAKYPELKDDDVWEAVQNEIMSDPEEARALDEATTPREISRILRAAAGRVTTERAKTTKTVETKDEKKREKETKNATQPVSRAVGKPRVAPSTSVDEKAPLKDRMRAFVEEHRATSGYKELH